MSSPIAPQTQTRIPPLHVIEPSVPHKHTIVLIHGLGSSGPAFSDAFFSSQSSQDFRTLFPTVRWVFPSAPTRYVPASQEYKPAWFQIASLSVLETDQAIQMQGLRESVEFLGQVLQDELERLRALGVGTEDMFVIARSQGSSAMVCTLLSRLHQLGRLGGIVLTGSWLVFARAIHDCLNENVGAGGLVSEVSYQESEARSFVRDVIPAACDGSLRATYPLQQTAILIGHSVDDEWINVTLGRQMRDLLLGLGSSVKWNEYAGAREEGHWLKEPEEFDDIALFLKQCMSRKNI